jgi:hypothetical protein
VANPSYSAEQVFAEAFVRRHHSKRLDKWSMCLVLTCFNHLSNRKRHFAIDEMLNPVDEDPDRRFARFATKSIKLSTEAVTIALEQADVGARVSEIGLKT